MFKKNRSSIAIILMKWSVWVFPIFALILSGMLFYDHFSKRGPLVKIHFQDAAGVEVGKTPVRFRGISVGSVEGITLADDGKQVIVMVRLEREAKNLAVTGSKFTIIRPKVDFGGIRGLETLLRGPYITVEKGPSNNIERIFNGVSSDEIDNANYVVYILHTPQTEAVDSGDPITFRGLKIGSVADVKLDATAQGLDVKILIEKKYVKLIRTNTLFWQKVGIDAKLGLFNSEIKISSLETLLKSGIAIGIPNNAGPIANAYTKFPLFNNPPKDVGNWNPKL